MTDEPVTPPASDSGADREIRMALGTMIAIIAIVAILTIVS